MKRTPLKANRETTAAWQRRSRQKQREKQTARTPLPRSMPEVQPKKGKRIKPVSDKRKVENAEYKVARVEYLELYPNCEICASQGVLIPATEIHHKRGREGPLLTDRRHLASTCSRCHAWVHANPIAARLAGWLESKHKNKDDELSNEE